MECAKELIGYQADADTKVAVAQGFGQQIANGTANCQVENAGASLVFGDLAKDVDACTEPAVETQTYSAPAYGASDSAPAYGASDYMPAPTSSYSYAQPAPVDAISCSDVTSLSSAQLKAACGIVETQPAMTQSTGVAQCPVGETYDVAGMKCEPNG